MTRLRVLRGGRDRAVTDPVLDGALRALRRGDAEEATEGSAVLRAERVRAIEAARLLAVRRKRSRVLVLLALGAAALVFTGWLVANMLLRGAPAVAVVLGHPKNVLYRSAGEKSFVARSSPRSLRAGDALRTAPLGAARLMISEGTEVTVAGDSEVGFPTQSSLAVQRLRLSRGSVAVVVRPLGEEERFVVEAGEHQVLVHGTEFSVTLAEGAAAPCVAVRRGVVEVRSPSATEWLRAGEDLGCELPTGASPKK